MDLEPLPSPEHDPMLGLTEAHHELRERVDRFATEHLDPVIAECEAEERFPREVLQKFGETGLLGGTIPSEQGGPGLDNISLCAMVEELGRRSQVFAGMVGGMSTVFGAGLLRYGSDDQRSRYLQRFARGESMGAFALTEARSGSDAAGMETAARKVDGGWVINGAKAWIDFSTVADWFLVFAQSDPSQGRHGICAFVVERGTEGFSTSEYRNKLGWRLGSVGGLEFDQCFLPDTALVGEAGKGYEIAMYSVGYGRLQVGARLTGGIRACLDESREYARSRRIFDKPIAELQLIQTKIVDMGIALDTGRYLTYRFARMLDEGHIARREGSMAKLYTAEALMQVAHDAVQIQGARGIGEDSVAGRMFRDAKVSEIVEGSNEVQRTLIAEYELGIRRPKRR
jgi:alkylation response protein AidB-like acyl-CoA dehydrogenase